MTGAGGLVGTALVDLLRSRGNSEVVCVRSGDCNLLDFSAVRAFFTHHRPDEVYHLAARVAGIMGNMRDQGGGFLDNSLMNIHVIEAARLTNCRKFVGMGSVAIYPFPIPTDPLVETAVWAGEPHHSESGYAHAKRNMLAQLQLYKESYGLEYAFAISTNLYGPGDRFDTQYGHVIPSLVRKFHEAAETGSEVAIWGNGEAKRDFLHARDAAIALELMMERGSGPINLASGHVYQIREVVSVLEEISGVRGRTVWRRDMPNGQLNRAFDIARLSDIGFRQSIDLKSGLSNTYHWYGINVSRARR